VSKPAKLNLVVREGATFRKPLRLLDARKKAVNLTGMTIRAEFRDKPDGALLMELTVGNGRLVVTPLTGQVVLVLTAAETEAITFAKAVWDLKVTQTNGDVVYPLAGSVIVERSVTE
jgi:hypothetical protein